MPFGFSPLINDLSRMSASIIPPNTMDFKFARLIITLEKLETGIRMKSSTYADNIHILLSLTSNAMALVKELGEQPGPPTMNMAAAEAQPPDSGTKAAPLVLHKMEFWQRTETDKGIHLQNGPWAEHQFTMGKDTFELTWERVETTLSVKNQLDKILTLDGYRLNKRDITAHVVKLWQGMMIDPDEHIHYQERFNDFMKRLYSAVKAIKESEVDVIDIFGRNTVIALTD
jgi:hypothetical protein